MDTADQTPRRPVRRPLPAVLAPSTARVLAAFLNREPELTAAWMAGVRRTLPIEEQLALEVDLEALDYVAGWQRAFAASDVGRVETAATDVARPSVREEITTREAADMLGVSDRHVRRLVAEKALRGRQVNARQLLVSRVSVLAYRQAVA